MKNLIIVGAGGFGREVLSYALDIQNSEFAWWKVKGFIDDNINALNNYAMGDYKILDTISNYKIQKDDVFTCAVARPRIKLQICNELIKRGAEFINLVHPTARIMDRARVGKGLIMAPYSCIGPDCVVGDFVHINRASSFGHDAVVETGCTFSSFCDVTGFAHLQEGVFMGSNSSVTPGVIVCKYAKISSGAIVFKNVGEDDIVYGNPAKKLY